MRIIHLCLFAFIVLLVASRYAYAADIYLTPHQSQIIPVAPGQIVKVKGRKIILIEDLGTKLRLVGLERGSCTLVVGTNSIQVFVLDKNKIEFFKALELKLQKFLGLKAILQEDEIAITGQIHRLSDWQEVTDLAEEYESTYSLRAQPDLDIQDEAIKWLRSRLQHRQLPMPHIVWSPSARAYISEDQKDLAAHWDAALAATGIARTYEKSQIAVEPLIQVRVVVAEVNKKMQQKLGIQWPDMISAQLIPTLKGPNTLDVFLKAMEQNGLGQILASPNLLARSGSEADFLAGGEFAIKILTARTRDVIWKRHGIYLKMKPRADRSGRLSIELSTEVSLIDASQTVDGIPALKTNRMATHFDLTEARTIVLSGLIRNDWGRSHEGISGLAKIPILGALFRSEDFFNNKSELVIFATPEIVNDQEGKGAPYLPHGWTQPND